MRDLCRIAALLGCLGIAAEARAQFAVPIGGYGFGFGIRNRHFAAQGFYGRAFYGYPGFGYGGYGYPGYGGFGYPSVRVINIYTPPPPTVIMPPIIINNNIQVGQGGGVAEPPNGVAQAVMDDDRFLKFMPRQKNAEAVRPPLPDRVPAPLPGDAVGGFRPRQPQQERPVERPAPPAMKPVDPPPNAAAPPPNPLPPRRPPNRPAANPVDENARQVDFGREAFADQRYGLAERRFQQAIRVAPEEPRAWFLLAQAQVALGKYQEAVESIEAGMRLQPDWAGSRFRVRQQYADNPNDYTDHLRQLQAALDDHPNDFALLFLKAYQLWFDGKQDEARPVFQRALKAAGPRDKPFVTRFLMHGQPLARQ